MKRNYHDWLPPESLAEGIWGRAFVVMASTTCRIYVKDYPFGPAEILVDSFAIKSA
jgi:hypothetical protein